MSTPCPTKTGKNRVVKLSPSVPLLLRELHQQRQPKPSDLVFCSPTGKPVDNHNFRNRAWKTILQLAEVEYRKPYSARATAISHALANGSDPLSAAEQAGHDPKVLFSSYASVIQAQSVFVEF